MTQLTLSIKQNFFDDILSGKKKNEIIEIRPQSIARYCVTDGEGYVIGPKQYDTLKLITGQFKGKRPYLIVKVISSQIITWEDFYEDYTDHQPSTIVYNLGEIMSTFKCNPHKN